MIFTCCEGDGTIFTGATGGTAFRLILDPVTYYNIAVVRHFAIILSFHLTKNVRDGLILTSDLLRQE
jgi:hypothetical protein